MNNPYPSAFERRVSAQANRLLTEQAVAVAEFQAARAAFAKALAGLHFPLGSPVKGYDLEDITADVDAWAVLLPEDEQGALDMAREAA